MEMPKIMMAGFTGLPESEPFITAAATRRAIVRAAAEIGKLK